MSSIALQYANGNFMELKHAQKRYVKKGKMLLHSFYIIHVTGMCTA